MRPLPHRLWRITSRPEGKLPSLPAGSADTGLSSGTWGSSVSRLVLPRTYSNASSAPRFTRSRRRRPRTTLSEPSVRRARGHPSRFLQWTDSTASSSALTSSTHRPFSRTSGHFRRSGTTSSGSAFQARGITGKGVRVAMPDTGHQQHPYFIAQNYHFLAVAAPDTVDVLTD